MAKTLRSLQLFILMQMWGSLPVWTRRGGGGWGPGGGGACNWGISLWGPMQIPNVLRVENKNSMGAPPATFAPSMDSPSHTQKLWRLFSTNSASRTFSAAAVLTMTPSWWIHWFHWSNAECRSASQTPPPSPGSSVAGPCVWMEAVYMVACGWD